MLDYIKSKRTAQFLVIGTILMLLGLIFHYRIEHLGHAFLYLSVFFLGYFASKKAIRDSIQDRSPNVDLLMILAALGALIIQEESEATILLFIFATAEVLEAYVTEKSTSAISSLMSQVPETAQLLQADGQTLEVPTEDLQVGDLILVAKGNQIPIDSLAMNPTTVNEMALTGEAVPVEKEVGDEVFAGTLNEGHAVTLQVTKTSDQTVFSNIIRMVEQAQNQPSKIGAWIDRFERFYVIGVLLAVPLFILALNQLQGLSFQDAFYRGMVLLTVASPCALVASVTPATLSAISKGARIGVLIKGGTALENLAAVDLIYSDKTGTLTYGNFEVLDAVIPEDILPLVVAMEQSSHHPIAQAIVKHYADVDLSQLPDNLNVQEESGMGLICGDVRVGKPAAFADYQDPNGYAQSLSAGQTTVIVAKGETVVGYLNLADQVRPESAQAVHDFQKEGVEVVMLTGDNEAVAERIAKEVAVDDFRANCLPQDKIQDVQRSQAAGRVVAMIGDGINDAPALANANVGIAMGSGSAIAMESAELVMVQNNFAKLFQVFKLSHKLNRIIWQNLFFSVGVIIILITLNILGLLDLTKGVIFHEMSTILVILNGLRLLK